MIRSMYSGISGMKVNQTKLDVIGNNISNVNTVAFKSSNTKFSDSLSQNVSNATGPTTSTGGINASQVGLGVQLASINSVMSQGNMQSTGRSLDCAIDGNGYFIVSSGPNVFGDSELSVNHQAGVHSLSTAGSNSQIMYTRDGSFIRDTEGNLLTGDGYRVMGYSLSNDDTSKQATEGKSSTVQIGSMKFNFGPGSQLNGYKIVLGTISENTNTTANVDKNKQVIVLNGDFSKNSTLTTDAINKALKDGLDTAGISQSINATGSIPKFENLSSDFFSGGTNQTSPDKVTIGGFSIQFPATSKLNNYSLAIGSVNQSPATASVDTNTKTITINANFIDSPTSSATNIKQALEQALKRDIVNPPLDDVTVDVTGKATTLKEVSAKPSEPKVGKAPTMTPSSGNYMGYTFGVANTGTGIDNQKIVFVSNSTATGVDVELKNNEIRIIGNFTQGHAPSFEQINNALNNKFNQIGTDSVRVTCTGGAYDSSSLANEQIKFSGGQDDIAAGGSEGIGIGGFLLQFPKPGVFKTSAYQDPTSNPDYKDFSKYTFKIVDLQSTTTSVRLNGDVVEISGNFLDGQVSKDDLALKLNQELGLTGDAKIQVKANNSSNANYDVLKSTETIQNGEDLKNAASQTAMGLEFQMIKGGAALNDYKIQIGQISAGTKTEVKVSQNPKAIIINGDFVTGNLTPEQIQSAINRALNQSSLAGVEIRVNGSADTMISFSDNSESDKTEGGTPVQSIAEDGTITYVDGTKKVSAYDGGLKSLKIPEKIKIAGSDEYKKVISYSIDRNGIILCDLEGGGTAAVGQIAMADFNNPEGLTKIGGNLYTGSVNSGNAVIKSGANTQKDDNSKAFGNINNKMLEASNVDLAEQFTDMIVATRAFQASGKMISTGDEILTEIINLKR